MERLVSSLAMTENTLGWLESIAVTTDYMMEMLDYSLVMSVNTWD